MLFVYKTSESYPSSQPNFFVNTKLNTCNTESVRGHDIKANHKSGLWYFEVEADVLHGDSAINGLMRCNLTGTKFAATFPAVRDLILAMESLNKRRFGF